LLAAIALAIECAGSVSDLAAWWQSHQPALRRLSPAELATAIAAKDARKRHLAGQVPAWHPEDSAA